MRTKIYILVQGESTYKRTIDLMSEYADRLVKSGIRIKCFYKYTCIFETDNCKVRFIPMNTPERYLKGVRADTVYGFGYWDRCYFNKDHSDKQPELNLFDYIHKIEKGEYDDQN